MFKLDRTAFKITTPDQQVDEDLDYWLSKSVPERLAASWYLTCCAYGLEYRADHKLDRTVFSMGKLSERDKINNE